MNSVLSCHVLIPSHRAGDEVIVDFCLPISVKLQQTNIGTDPNMISVSVEH